MDRYRLIDEHPTLGSVQGMCRVLEVSRSGFYAWKKRPESPRAGQTRRLDAAIRAAYQASQGRSGSPKITQALRQQGFPTRVPQLQNDPGSKLAYWEQHGRAVAASMESP